MLNAGLIGITLLVIIGLSLLFYTLVKVTPEESFASAIMSILVLVYVTGLIGNTKIALGIIYVLALVGVVLSVIAVCKQSEYSLKTFWSPGILMACGITVVGVVAFKGMLIYNWDELYQWGKAADYMVLYDKLPNGPDFSGESILLSSTTFFHYFMARLSAGVMGEITESNYYVSNLLLWFSALLLPFSGEGWKNWKRVWAFGVFHFLLAALIFVQPYYNIYTDQPTAYWAGGMIAWLLAGKCKKRNLYLIPLVLINVGLMKSMVGPLFAVIVILAIIVLYCVACKEQGKHILPAGWNKVLFSKKGLLGIVGILSPFILIGVWSALTGQNGLLRFHGLTPQPGEEDRAVETLKSMIGWIFDSVTLKDEKLYLSYGIFIILTVGIVYILYPVLLKKKDNNRYRGLMNIYIIGFVGYFVVMFVAYMLVFGYVDSIRAMSLNRYYSDYMMLGVVPLTLPLFQWSVKEQDAIIRVLKKGTICVFMVCILYGVSDYFLENLVHAYALDTKNYAERERFEDYCEEIKELTDGEGKIYFVNQTKSGLFTLVADYELGEQLSRTGMCYKFRKDTSEPILGLTEYPIATLPAVLREQGYEYLWVYSNNEYFVKNMKEMFELDSVKKGSFYKVVCNEDGSVSLEYLGKVK